MKQAAFLTIISGFFLASTTLVSAAAPAALPHIPVCPPGAKEDSVRCHARVIVDGKGKPLTSTTPTGYGPAQIQGAYNLAGKSAGGRTVAIVDAYDDPTAEQDLDNYSLTYGLPVLPTCPGWIGGSVTPCFIKVDQNGGMNYPAVDAGWALEISLDIQAAHAACPDCKILLVEANSSSYTDLMAAVDQAAGQGVTAISGSWGSGEFSGETSFDPHFNKPGLAFTFSAGDNGYRTGYPAASRFVTSVGGTSLYLGTNNTYGSETVWSGTGSGCSKYESKPGWQHDTGCANRTMNDVAADADPNTGAAVLDTTPYQGQIGWFQVGGTSLSSPLIAAVYTLSGNTDGSASSLPYSLFKYAVNLHDVTSGRNGSCSYFKSYLCKAKTGYDGPTGLGTPNGTGAF